MVFGALGIIRPFTETSPDIHLLTYYSLPKTALKLQKKKTKQQHTTTHIVPTKLHLEFEKGNTHPHPKRASPSQRWGRHRPGFI
jgi:hypothetical protein